MAPRPLSEFERFKRLKELKANRKLLEQLRAIAEEAIPALWVKGEAVFVNDDDVKDLAIFGSILDQLMLSAEAHNLQPDELIPELAAAAEQLGVDIILVEEEESR